MQIPTKKVKRGRKPASECSGDFCQLCKCAFKVKFGDIDDIKGHTIILVCGELITIQTISLSHDAMRPGLKIRHFWVAKLLFLTIIFL